MPPGLKIIVKASEKLIHSYLAPIVLEKPIPTSNYQLPIGCDPDF